MTEVTNNASLQKYNTFHLNVTAKHFTQVFSIDDVKEIIKLNQKEKLPILILGDGANILFTKDYDGLVIKNSIIGKKIIEENDEYIILEALSGEDWPDLVTYAVSNNWSGIENLAYIPGTVGASPVQNIAAYGQSLEDTFVSLEAINLETGEIKTFTKSECNFKYRNSIFKQELKDKYFILSVRLKLSKYFQEVNTSYHSRYESVKDELNNFSKPPFTLKNIYDAIIRIRQKKLPDVNKIGTVGSTFANPFLSKEQLTELQKKVPNIQFYPVDKMQYPNVNDPLLQNAEIVKVPAGWLLEEAGWKNKRVGNVGTYQNHALCVVAYEDAKPEEVYAFTEMMRKDFKEKYQIELQYEVNIV